MALRAPARQAVPKLAAVSTTAAVLAVILAGCGGSRNSGTRGPQSAADFIRQVTTQFSLGQTGPLWDSLHPADQAVVSRARYMACHSSSGFDLQKFTVLQTYADTVDVSGKATASTAVSVRVTSDDGVTTATMHAIELNGKWRWILSPADYSAYRQGKCPSA
jgi:uncharacterized protein YchJ